MIPAAASTGPGSTSSLSTETDQGEDERDSAGTAGSHAKRLALLKDTLHDMRHIVKHKSDEVVQLFFAAYQGFI